MNTQETNFARLESTILSKSNEQKTSGLASKLHQFWNLLIESMITVGELKVRASKNKFGSIRWTIDDPLIGRRMHFHSETEVREWLDRRYYQ
jgi:hypothetical protein